MRNIWVTADTHYDHANIIRFSKRPWLQPGDEIKTDNGTRWCSAEIAKARADEMNEAMIQWHNELVKPGDEVWHLGDFIMSKDRRTQQARTEYFVRRLNGQYHWIFGNHDHTNSRKAEGFVSKGHYGELRGIGDEKATLCLFHYACRTWNKRHHGSIMLYGHSHGSLRELNTALSYDVGVDCHNYRPVHIDVILTYMRKKRESIEAAGKSWKGDDHHGDDR